MMTKARWRGTEAIARETPAGSLSVASMPQRKDYTNDAEHHGKFQVWLQAGSFQGKAREINKTATPNKGWEKDRVPTCASRIL